MKEKTKRGALGAKGKLKRTAARAKEKLKRTAVKMNQNKFYYLLILPAVVLLFIFAYKPMYVEILAFKK